MYHSIGSPLKGIYKESANIPQHLERTYFCHRPIYGIWEGMVASQTLPRGLGMICPLGMHISEKQIKILMIAWILNQSPIMESNILCVCSFYIVYLLCISVVLLYIQFKGLPIIGMAILRSWDSSNNISTDPIRFGTALTLSALRTGS